MKLNEMMITLLDGAGEVVLKKKLIGIPLREECVLKRSVEYFNDPEPCMIHRSAVMKVLYSELFDHLAGLPGGKVGFEKLPERARSLIAAPESVRYISIEAAK